MELSDSNRFRDLIRGMSRIYGKEPDALILDAYWLALRGWEFEDVQTAAGHLMQTSTLMPRPVDFAELRDAGPPTVREAWDLACKASGSAMQCGYESIRSAKDVSTRVDRLEAVAIVHAINQRGGYLLMDTRAEGTLRLIVRRRHLVPLLLIDQVIMHGAEICKVLKLGLRAP